MNIVMPSNYKVKWFEQVKFLGNYLGSPLEAAAQNAG